MSDTLQSVGGVSSENTEVLLSFDEYCNQAHAAQESNDTSTLSQAVTGMFHTATTIEQVKKIKDYMIFHGGAFDQMLIDKAESIRNQNLQHI